MNLEATANLTAMERVAESLGNIEVVLAFILALNIIQGLTLIVFLYGVKKDLEE